MRAYAKEGLSNSLSLNLNYPLKDAYSMTNIVNIKGKV